MNNYFDGGVHDFLSHLKVIIHITFYYNIIRQGRDCPLAETFVG